MKIFAATISFLLFLALQMQGALTGEEVYKARCSGCHDQVSERVPPKSTLQGMPSAGILRALNLGAMMTIGFKMSQEDRASVASYLGTKGEVAVPLPSAYCSDRSVKLSANPKGWDGWGPGFSNARFQTADMAGLTVDGVRKLKLKWAFGFDGDVTAFAEPAVLDGHLFVGSASGLVHAMRADRGCLEWVYQANGPVRSSITAVPISGGKHALLFGDMTGWFYALEAESGKALWKVQVEQHDSTRLSGGPVAYKGVVYVPVASWEEQRSSDPGYVCCTFRGSVVALNIADGKQLWKTYMVPDPPQPLQNLKNPKGNTKMGPSGVGVWSRPTLDEKRNLLYVTTGDNYSPPATSQSDAVLALDLKTGSVVWVNQITPDDICCGTCAQDGVKCGPDFDFGSSSILVTPAGGKQLLVAGQKSGVVWALDPDKKGELVWQTRVGVGGTNGGIQWGMASDGEFIYAAVSDMKRTRNNIEFSTRLSIDDPEKGGGVTALRVSDGSKLWYAQAKPCPAGSPLGCSPAQPGAVTAIPGAVFSGSMDGHIRAFSSESGGVLWEFDTARDFTTVNGVKARGGSLDGPGPVVVNGMVYVNSGYPRNGGMPGNVMLAFGPE